MIDLGEVDMLEPGAKEPAIVKPTVIQVRRGGDARQATKPEASEPVTLCAHGLSRGGLVAGLAAVLETELEPSDADAREEKELPFSGTVDELLDYLDLRRRDSSAAS